MTERRDIENAVREALQSKADEVRTAPDALVRIRARTAGRRRTWTVAAACLATAATVAAAAVAVALAGGIPRPETHDVPPASQVPGQIVRLPIYYVGGAPGAPVLYREFHPVPSGGSAAASLAMSVRAALDIMLAGRPFDPDYRSEWPASVRVVSVDAGPVAAEGGAGGPDAGAGVAVVDLSGDMPAGTEGATALQQLVWTVTAVAADQGVPVTGVRVRHDGADWSGAPLTRAPALETLAPVWLISPQQGDTVGGTVGGAEGGALDVHIAAELDATIRLWVRDAAGNTVSNDAVPIVATAPSATATATATASRGEAHVSLTLAPGRYTVEAYVAADGSSSAGSPAPAARSGATDDHVITVVAPSSVRPGG